MRKLGKKNIILFVIFSFIVLIVIGIFSISVFRTMKVKDEEYNVLAGSYIYDYETKFISIDNNGIMKKKWTGKYYLTENDTVYNLGEKTVIYNAKDFKIYAYGTIYQVFEGGKIETKTKQTEIVRIGTPCFYKIDDRKYLIVGKSIKSKDEQFATTNYLVVHLDKMGNALLMNNQEYVKTINPMILVTSDFQFDVANEKLIFPNEEIDLKNINGSTNEYVPVKKVNTGNTTINNNNQTNNNVNVGSIVYGKNDNNETEIIKWLGLKSLTPGVTYIDIDYQVIDVKDEYHSVFLIIEDGENNRNKIYLNKQSTNYRIKNLKPNYEYKISFGYTYLDNSTGTNTVIEKIDDVSVVSTSKAKNVISVTKITSKGINFNVKIDKEYKFDEATATLYMDDLLNQEMVVDINKAVSTDGFSAFFPVTSWGHKITIKLEKIKYGGDDVIMQIETTYIND